jgi:hypothetical protein
MKVDTKGECYSITFDTGYFKDIEYKCKLPEGKLIKNEANMQEWVDALPHLKHVMDMYFSKNEKAERIYQQIVCRENNRSRISNSTSYFIVDIEYDIMLPERTEDKNSQKQAKIDMIAVKWPASSRSGKKLGEGLKENTVHLAFIEMKYGDNALKGDAGIEKHLKDMKTIKGEYETIRESAEKQLNTLNRLGLIEHANPDCIFKVVCDKPEYILLLASSNPQSSILKSDAVLKVCNEYANDAQTPFALKVFMANYAGYGFFDPCVIDWKDFVVK